MALDRLTKVDGGSISTTSDYRVGIITATKFIGPIEGDVTGSITATDGTFSGNVTIGGTLTYEDVTNIDSVGIVTARDGIHVGAGVSVVGVVTATTFVGALTGTASGNPTLANGANNRIVTATGANALTGEANLTWTGSYFETSGGAESWTMRAKSGGPSSKIGFQNQYLANGYTIGCGAANKSFVVYTDGQNNGERLRIDQTGISTFSQNLFASKDFDVDGHTNLDNVSIAGVTTASGDLFVDGNIVIPTSGRYFKLWTGGTQGITLNHGGTYGELDNLTGMMRIKAGSVNLANRYGNYNFINCAANGSVDLYYDAQNHTTPKLATSATGVTIDGTAVAGGLDISGDIDVDGHTNLDNVSIAGIVTATRFVGALTGTASGNPTLTGGSNNRVITATGANALTGEANLTYDGNTLQVATDTNMEGIKITSSGNTYNDLIISANRSGSNNHIGRILGQWNGQNVSAIIFNTGGDTSGKDDGKILFATSNGGASPTTRMTIEQDGQIGLGGNPTHKLEIFNAADAENILMIRGADNTTEYAAMGVSGGNAIITGGGVGGTDAGLVFRTAAGGNEDERLRIDTSGRLLVGSGAIANPKSSGAGSIDLDNQAFTIIVGGNHPGGGRSDNTAKTFRMSMVHNTLAEEPINILQGYCDSSDNNLYIGGGTGSANSLTQVRVYTGTNTTTTGGTERLRIHSDGRVSINTTSTTFDGVTGNLNIANDNYNNHTVINLSRNTTNDRSQIRFSNPNGNIGSINTSGSDLKIISTNHITFDAAGNPRGRVYDDAGVTGIEHHQFHPFLIGYNANTASNVTMVPRFGGMSALPITHDGDKAYMCYTTHWRHREYAGVYFWYGASGNTSGHTFDWDFTVYSATHAEGYTVGSQHTFTISTGSMSNGKMYRMNALSSWPSHHGAELVQFEIEYDEILTGTVLQLSGMEIIEYTQP